jgi:hypothetical protein
MPFPRVRWTLKQTCLFLRTIGGDFDIVSVCALDLIVIDSFEIRETHPIYTR